MKNTKKIFATLTAACLVMTGTAFAAEDEIMLIQESEVLESAITPVINGAILPSVEVVEVDGITMIPLRLVGEGLGFEVIWNDENQSIDLAKGAQFITMQIGSDAYAFSRQAHRSLGTAPILYNDTTTYVPISFITEILGGVYTQNEDKTYEIINPAIVTVTEVLEDGSILVNDGYLGEVLVRIAETTALTDGTNTVDASVIEAGMTLAVGYDIAMTMSIPPQTTARFIRVENLPMEEVEVQPAEEVAFGGIITEIEGELVTVGNPAEDHDAVRLVVSKDTVITDSDGNAASIADLSVGMEIKGAHSAISTFSIPPQSVAYRVEIVK